MCRTVWLAVDPIWESLAQALTGRMPAAKGRHDGNDHRVLTGTLGQNCPVDPERQTTVLGGVQVGETVGARLL